MNEYGAIDLIVKRLGSVSNGAGVVIGPGDDSAVVQFHPQEQTVVTSDVLVEQRHFPIGSPGDLVGYRSVAANVSDLSSMGARPRYLVIALTTESIDESWLLSFSDGVRACCMETGCIVIGGNLARGPLSIAITALGSVLKGKAVARSGAEVGDDIWLTGCVGASTVALEDLQVPRDCQLQDLLRLRERDPVARYFLPVPRVHFASYLSEFASSATDVSDGLVSELGQLSRCSGKRMTVDIESVSVWSGADPTKAIQYDDSYEILLTAHPSKRAEILSVANRTETAATQIGAVHGGDGVEFHRGGRTVKVGEGFSHF